MSFAVFYCLSTILLFVLFFTYTSTYIARRRPRFIYKIHLDTVKDRLEETYDLHTHEDSIHKY